MLIYYCLDKVIFHLLIFLTSQVNLPRFIISQFSLSSLQRHGITTFPCFCSFFIMWNLRWTHFFPPSSQLLPREFGCALMETVSFCAGGDHAAGRQRQPARFPQRYYGLDHWGERRRWLQDNATNSHRCRRGNCFGFLVCLIQLLFLLCLFSTAVL